MGFGLVLIVLGAILDFAISVDTEGFNINTIGLILLVVGIISFLVGLVVVVMGSQRRTVVQEDVRQTPAGSSRVIEERDTLSPGAFRTTEAGVHAGRTPASLRSRTEPLCGAGRDPDQRRRRTEPRLRPGPDVAVVRHPLVQAGDHEGRGLAVGRHDVGVVHAP